ncbi:MAG TPA: hypothetical protein VII75_03895 [Thermoanaerobaculia bacterium]
MNPAIRKWIETNRQPWRRSPELSALRGRTGASGALPLNRETVAYFANKGVSVEGKFIEELMEGELLAVLETVSRWLPEADRRLLDESIAFGTARTYEAMAMTIPCLDGYAILFGDTFDTLLIGTIELYFGFLLDPKIVAAEELPLALNTAIVATFFHRANYWTPIPRTFAHRELTSRCLWLMDVFILSHEIGHAVRGHLDATNEDDVTVGEEVVTVARTEREQEFEADRYAIELIRAGETAGGLFLPGADRNTFWNSAYATLSWLFCIFGAIERIRLRLEMPSVMSHPEAAERWKRLDPILRECAPIDAGTIRLAELMRVNAYRSADLGELPRIVDAPEYGPRLAPIAYSDALAKQLVDHGLVEERRWTPPSDELFLRWINAPAVSAAKELLLAHPELLHPKVDVMHYELADEQPDDTRRHHILVKRLPLLERSRAIGVEAAFTELAQGRAPAAEPEPYFELRIELLQQYVDVARAGDADRAQALLDASPELAAFLALPVTVERFAGCGSVDAAKPFLLAHPELQVESTDQVFAELASRQTTDEARRRVETFRAIVARARQFGVARAMAEANVRWNLPSFGT